MEFVWFILVGALAGYLGNVIMKRNSLGFWWCLLIGILGGFVGGWVFDLLGISAGGGIIGSLICSLVGAVLLLWIVSLFRKKR